MKGNLEVIDSLNALLRSELAAVIQYEIHASLSEVWGYGKLSDYIETRAKEEMGHAGRLMDRIVFLEGLPQTQTLPTIATGSAVQEHLLEDQMSEMQAITDYNEAVRLCANLGDNASRDLLESILVDENRHLQEIEEHIYGLEQMGLANFLSTQV